MALQATAFVSGRIGNLVFFERAGKHMARSLPGKVNMSAASKVCGGKFGLASGCTKYLRQQLAAVLPDTKDRNMQLRFSGAAAKWLTGIATANIPPTAAVPYVGNFQFNTATCIAERCKLALNVTMPSTNQLTLHIPAFTPKQAIAAPAHTVSVTCTITAAGSLLHNAAATGHHTVSFDIPYNAVGIPEQMIALPVATPAGALVVTAISLRYKLTSGQYCTAPGFLPASVVDARYC